MQNPSQSPESLLLSARVGVVDSMGVLLQLYGNYLKLLATTQLDAKLRSRVSPSDVVQETLLEAHRDFPTFRGSTEPELLAWLRRILLNNLGKLVEQHIVTEKRDIRREYSLERAHERWERSSVNLRNELVGDGPTPSAAFEQLEASRVLADQVAELPDDYRTVIVKRHLEGLPFKEIAEQMGRSPGAVRMLWLRAIDILRERFREEGLL